MYINVYGSHHLHSFAVFSYILLRHTFYDETSFCNFNKSHQNRLYCSHNFLWHGNMNCGCVSAPPRMLMGPTRSQYHVIHFVLDGEHPKFFQIVTSRSERKYPIEPLTDLSFPEFLPLFFCSKKNGIFDICLWWMVDVDGFFTHVGVQIPIPWMSSGPSSSGPDLKAAKEASFFGQFWWVGKHLLMMDMVVFRMLYSYILKNHNIYQFGCFTWNICKTDDC